MTWHEALEQLRRQFVMDKLREANGNQVHASELASVHRNTFNRMTRDAGITDNDIQSIRRQCKQQKIRIVRQPKEREENAIQSA